MRDWQSFAVTGARVRKFGWIAARPVPPAQLDLQGHGWTLCCSAGQASPECPNILLIDGRGLSTGGRRETVERNRPLARLIVYGVDDEDERAELLALGCGEVLSSSVKAAELRARAQRVSERLELLPRRRFVGQLTLDLIYRDARHGRRWLYLHPREFEVLWRLAERPGAVVTRKDLLRDVWRIAQEPETNSVEVHVSRLRAKLAGAGCAGLVQTVAEGGYRVAEPAEADGG